VKTLLVDGDMLVYRSCSACVEVSPFNKDIIVRADIEEMKRNVELRIKQCEEVVFEHFDEAVNTLICFSSGKNFRYDVNPDYKANRRGKEKPINYYEVKDWCKSRWEYAEEPVVEADDLMGIMQDEDTVIVTGDKDLKQIAGHHLNLIDPERGVESIAEDDAWEFTLLQAITGDPTDNIVGVPRWGKTKAKNWLEEHGYTWESVVSAYESAMSPKTKDGKKIESKNLGLTEEDALFTMRQTYILRHEEELHEGEVKLWVP
jgi:5'-3' exonuclease